MELIYNSVCVQSTNQMGQRTAGFSLMFPHSVKKALKYQIKKQRGKSGTDTEEAKYGNQAGKLVGM